MGLLRLGKQTNSQKTWDALCEERAYDKLVECPYNNCLKLLTSLAREDGLNPILNQTLDTKNGALIMTKQSSKIEATSLTEASFKDVNLKLANFTDVNLAGSSFSDVSLAGATFHNVDLSNVAITDANLDGMLINGILVTELLRVYDA